MNVKSEEGPSDSYIRMSMSPNFNALIKFLKV